MASSNVDAEILRQLAEMQQTLGATTATIEGIREDIQTNTAETMQHRDTIMGNINNALMRIGQLEKDVKNLMHTMDKTVNPLLQGYSNSKQRAIGFLAAWGMFGTGVGFIFWLLTGGFAVLAGLFAKLVQSP